MAEKVYLEVQEVKRLEDEAIYLRDKLLIRILARTGCRISEALSIKPSDIDFDRGLLTIKHLKVRSRVTCPSCGARLAKSAKYCPGCGATVSEVTTRAEEQQRMRNIPIDDETLGMLKEYIERGGARNGNIFGINRSRAWQIIHDLAQKVGLPQLYHPESGKKHSISPHRLRDAFAVMAVKVDDSGDGLRMLQEQLGHQNYNTTMKYRKLSGQELKDWYSKIWKP